MGGDRLTGRPEPSGAAASAAIAKAITVCMALFVVVTFYAHTIFSLPSGVLTPLITMASAGMLVALALLGALTLRSVAAGTPARSLSVLFLYASLLLAALSTLRSAMERSMSTADLGVFFIQVATPCLLFFVSDRAALLRWVCRFAVAFAFADLAANLASHFGLATIAQQIGEGTAYGSHYLGIPGNSFAEGIIAFLALAYIAAGVPYGGPLEMLGRAMMIVALFGSELMIRARADIGMSLVAVGLLIFWKSHYIPLVLVAAGVSGALLGATFLAPPADNDDHLRGDLIVVSSHEAEKYPLLGAGIRYRESGDVIVDFVHLRDYGITESGAIDYAIAYGLTSTVFLYLSCMFALSAHRVRQTLPAVLLAILIGALSITGALVSFIGSLVLYLSLIMCQREEYWTLQHSNRGI